MLKLVFMLGLIFPLCLIKNSYWMVHSTFFVSSFIFIVFNYYGGYFVNISYFLGCDLLSYGLILLSLWICSLMLMAKSSVYKFNNYSNFF